METAVLPAHDHLAQQRYRHQSRVMSGIIYPFDLPRTRRKVKSPPKVFASASVRAETDRVSLNQNMRSADSSGNASPTNATLPLSSSSPTQFPVSGKDSQYRLSESASAGFILRETSSFSHKPRHATNSASNGASSIPRHVLRTKSDGELLQGLKKLAEAFSLQGVRRSTEVDKVVQRTRPVDRSLESTKDLPQRKPLEKMHEKIDKQSDRRRNFDRRTLEKKTNVSSSQGDRCSTLPPKKSGVITILQRPQTKEAAAENLAKFIGRSTVDLQETKLTSVPQIKETAAENTVKCSARTFVDVQILRPTPVTQRSPEMLVERSSPAQAALMVDMLDAEGLPRDVDHDKSVPARSPTVSPKMILKRRSSVEHLGKIVAQNTADVDGNSAGNGGKLPLSRSVEGLNVKERKLVDVRRDLGVGSPTRVDQITMSEISARLTPARGAVNTGVLGHESSDSSAGESEKSRADVQSSGQSGVSRSGSFREGGLSGDDSDDQMFFSSTPFKSNERWAGPAYSNSPPPSTLPFPSFPSQRAKSSLTEGTLPEAAAVRAMDQNSTSKSSSAPASPTRVNSLFFPSVTAMQSPFMDASSATKDLRRILNLNVDVALKDGLESINRLMIDEATQATQSLKRILQLG